MNGIVAIVGHESNESNKLIKSMCRALEHRGPEDSGWFTDSTAVLGSVASSTNTKRFAHQPISNKTKTIWITFDGAIKNRDKLKSQLAGSKLSTSDAELVLHLYEENGEKCTEKLDGVFAFCLFDSSRKRLLCARDRFGVKQLYYFRNTEKGIFASEIKALFQDSSVPRKPNHELIGKYLLTGYHYRNGNTFFESIKEVLPGHYIIWDVERNIFQEHEYWHLQTPSIPPKEDIDYPSRFLSLLRTALDGLVPRDCPYATLLSGGIDSQTIATLVSEIAETDYAGSHTLISAICKHCSLENNEEPYIREYERFRNAKICYVFLPYSLPWKTVKDLAYQLEEPMGLLNSCLLFYIAEELQRKGVKVALSGNAADAFLWGLDFEQRHYLADLWERRDFWAFFVETIGFMLQRDFSHNILSKIKETIRTLLPSKLVSDASYYLDQQYIAKYSVAAQESIVDRTLGDIVQSTETSDRIFSAFGVEIRHPFLDADLVDFMIKLPPDQKIRRGVKKYILRETSKGLVPEAIRKSRKKFATSIPIVEWIKSLQPEITGILLSKSFSERRIFNPSNILKAFNLLCEGRLNEVQSQKLAVLVWRIIDLELWFQIYIDPEKFEGKFIKK